MEKIEENLDKYGYLDCDNIIPLARKKYDAAPNDPATLAKVYSQLKGAKCFDDPMFLEVAVKLNGLEPNAARAAFIASKMIEQNDYSQALIYANQAAELEDDPVKKANQYYNVAELHQRQGSFSAARTAAQQAAKLRLDWGKPYLLIGRLYAASGKLCGPGTGWDSQVVVWPALDMFYKAKSIDPSVAADANKQGSSLEDLIFYQI